MGSILPVCRGPFKRFLHLLFRGDFFFFLTLSIFVSGPSAFFYGSRAYGVFFLSTSIFTTIRTSPDAAVCAMLSLKKRM